MDKQEELYWLCKRFVNENKIRCPETVYQTDWVIQNAYEFIEQICEIVGYHKDEEGEE